MGDPWRVAVVDGFSDEGGSLSAEVQDPKQIEELITRGKDTIAYVRGHVVQAVQNEQGNWGTLRPREWDCIRYS